MDVAVSGSLTLAVQMCHQQTDRVEGVQTASASNNVVAVERLAAAG